MHVVVANQVCVYVLHTISIACNYFRLYSCTWLLYLMTIVYVWTELNIYKIYILRLD